MLPIIRNVHFEQSPDRLKVVLPVKRHWPWLILFSLLMLFWLIGFVWGIVFTIRDVAFSGERFAIVFTIMLLIWLYIWYRLGKILWKQWQYYTANREILFINKEHLIIRRPVSMLGITDAYDMEHVSPFYYNLEHHCLSFAYGSQRIDFGYGLEANSASLLATTLNDQYFPALDDDDDED